jgi:voltage-gated potassium channel
LVAFRGPESGVVAGIGLLIVVLVTGVIGFSLIENWSFLDAFYMTVISISTVGYSEVNPLSDTGRWFASFVIFAGLGTVFFTTTMLGRVILEGELRGT